MKRPTALIGLLVLGVLGVAAVVLVNGDQGSDLNTGSGGEAVGQSMPFELVPLTGFAASPEEVLVVDSATSGDAARMSSLDVASREWSEVPASPFTSALFAPDVFWTGSEFVVVGTACGKSSDNAGEAFPRCEPGGVEIASYSPGSRQWTAPASVGERGVTATAQIIGATGDVVVVGANGPIFTVDVAKGTSHQLPERSFDSGVNCLVDDQLVSAAVLNGPAEEGGDVNRFPPVVASSLSLSDPEAWSQAAYPGESFDVNDNTFSLTCAAEGPIAVLYDAPISGATPQSFVYDTASGSWRAIAAPPLPVGVIQDSVSLPSELVAWTNLTRAIFRSDEGWTVTADDGTAIRVAAIDETHVVVHRTSQPELVIEEV
jgi:hypothetical protein